jgi:serine protease Do
MAIGTQHPQTQKHSSKSRGRTKSGFLLLALLCLPLSPTLAQNEKPKERKPSRAALFSLQEAFSEIADELEPAVVTILSLNPVRNGDRDNSPAKGLRRSTGTGSGVLISADGWILTNEHVTGGIERVKVRLNDGREFTGAVRGDSRSDLALVKIEDKKPLPFARLGNSDGVKIGHWAIAIGSPYKYEGTFSVGVISNLSRRQEIVDPSVTGGVRFYPQMFQTDAAINPGNSGGPLCNLDGEVIAVNTAIESDGGGSIGIGFAIPINSAKYVIRQLKETGRVQYGYLGVEPRSIGAQLASTLNLMHGAYLQSVQDDSPAYRAGLRTGDVVISIGEKTVRNEADFRIIVSQTQPGTLIELTALRKGERLQMRATVGEMEPTRRPNEEQNVLSRLGIEVQPLTNALIEKLNVASRLKGVVVKTILPGTPASDSPELEEGAVIFKVNDQETPNVKAFQEVMEKLKHGERVTFFFMVGRLKKSTTITVE